MIRVESPKDQVNVAKVYEAHQEQIFEYWDELSAGERKRLLGQIDTIDFREFSRLLRTVFNGGEKKEVERLADLTPMEMIPLPPRPPDSRQSPPG
ncbi:MAG: hypothetical protein ACE5GW_10855 [Planctomycetota bacterium]